MTGDPLAARAAAIRAERARAARLAPWARDIERERARLLGDILAAVPEMPESVEMETR